VALCKECHQGAIMGWHGEKAMWRIKKMDELDAMHKFAALLEEAVYKQAYEIALYAPFKKSADLIMKEIDEEDRDPDAEEDFFKTADFRFCMNNAIKATTFTICTALRERGKDEQ
jgi:hypothetical protein